MSNDISEKFFVWSTSQDFFQKNIFRQKYTNAMSIDSVFDEDYESTIIFCENRYMKNENCKVRVQFKTFS